MAVGRDFRRAQDLPSARHLRSLHKSFDEQSRFPAVQPLLLNQSVSNFPAPAVTWSDVARVCRRVCLLRERGQNEEAERIRAGELMPLVAAVRSPGDSEAATTDRLNALFAIEAERVANAAVLAEILLPMIAEQVRSPASTAPTPPEIPIPVVLTPAPARPKQPRPASIADFIDDMIAQENPPDRPGGAQRRAS
jgi:hypothetical protein